MKLFVKNQVSQHKSVVGKFINFILYGSICTADFRRRKSMKLVRRLR